MEDTHRDKIITEKPDIYKVLILVLMEDTHRVLELLTLGIWIGLNPCSNGRYSQSYEYNN